MADTLDKETKDAKTGLHFCISKLAQDLNSNNDTATSQLTISKEVVAVVTEASFRLINVLAKDLEAFCKHARRSTVTADDVKLAARRNPTLLHHLSELSDKISASEPKKMKRKTKRTKEPESSERPDIVLLDDESNQNSTDVQ